MAIAISNYLSAISLTLPVNVYANLDWGQVGTSQTVSTASLVLHNLTNEAVSISQIGLANSTNEMPCIKLGGDTDRWPITIPANGNITLQNNGDASYQFHDNIINFSASLRNYFQQNPSVNDLDLDLLYFVHTDSFGIDYIALPSSFSTSLSAVRDRLRVTNNTFNKSIYQIGETITGTITLENQGCYDIGYLRTTSTPNVVDRGYGVYILGNDDLTGGIFDGYNGEMVIPAKSSVTLSFSTVAAYTEEMRQYLEDNPSERAVPITNLTNKYGYTAYTSSHKQASVNNLISTVSLINTASISGSIYVPSIDSFVVERSISGVVSDEGVDILSSFKVSTANGVYPASFALTITDNNGVSYDATSFIVAAMSGIIRNDTIISNQYSNGSDYTFTLFFGDQYESVSMSYSISNAFANLHLSGQPTGGACFGGFSASTLNNPKLESYYPIYAYDDIIMVDSNNVSHSLVDMIYPIGSIYMSTNNVDPSAIFPNTTWTQIQDTFLLSAGTDYTAGDTGGSKTHTHQYGMRYASWWDALSFENSTDKGIIDFDINGNQSFSHTYLGSGNSSVNSAASGSRTTRSMSFYQTVGHTRYTSTLPPYLVVYMWTRTA